MLSTAVDNTTPVYVPFRREDGTVGPRPEDFAHGQRFLDGPDRVLLRQASSSDRRRFAQHGQSWLAHAKRPRRAIVREDVHVEAVARPGPEPAQRF